MKKKKIKHRRRIVILTIESSEDTEDYNYLINFIFPRNRELGINAFAISNFGFSKF